MIALANFFLVSFNPFKNPRIGDIPCCRSKTSFAAFIITKVKTNLMTRVSNDACSPRPPPVLKSVVFDDII
jgi:hypothetical protein